MDFTDLLACGLKPYIATSHHLIPSFDLNPFGIPLTPFLNDEKDTQFHLSYMRSNSIAFDADLGMPNWVYIDFVVLQKAVVGFMAPRDFLPKSLVEKFASDKSLRLEELDSLPISGQTAGLAADKESWTGVSLFSLAKHIPEVKSLGLATATRALALTAYTAKKFIGITQYDNPAVAIHGKTTQGFYIKEPIVWVHPRTHMTFVYEQEVNFKAEDLVQREAEQYSFLLKSDDLSKKREIASEMKLGKRFRIVPPFRIVREDGIFIPIVEE